MHYEFKIGNFYKRKDIFRIIGVPENTRGGPWFTGYRQYKDDSFIFCNINTAGRTGHEYFNKWLDDDLQWFGTKKSHKNQPTIKSLLNGNSIVYIFARTSNSEPFVFVGCGKPKNVSNTSPIMIVWELLSPLEIERSITSQSQKVTEDASSYTTKPIYIDNVLQKAEDKLQVASIFSTDNSEDTREHIIAAVVKRRGQPAFRKKLIAAYDGRCAISQTSVLETLEAAHITPYRGNHSHHLSNGLLLRSDIHTLFDLGHITVQSESLKVEISNDLMSTEYSYLHGRCLILPADTQSHPSRSALQNHYEYAQRSQKYDK